MNNTTTIVTWLEHYSQARQDKALDRILADINKLDEAELREDEEEQGDMMEGDRWE